MTMEEVNEKFPLTKYKTWRSSRAQEGLPTAGGITTTSTSKPASLRHARLDSKEESSIQELAQTSTLSTVDEKTSIPEHSSPEIVQQDQTTTAAAAAAAAAAGAEAEARPTTPRGHRPQTSQSTSMPPDTPVKEVTTHEDDADEDDDQIQTAVPPEQLPDPGDACAICIDTIEDDDDIRGLDCGHAFHASCVDPWLTSRRACCPLCKADYYVPKPRPDATDAEELRRRGTASGMDLPPPPAHLVFIGGRSGPFGRRPPVISPARFMGMMFENDRDRRGSPRVVREQRSSRQRLSSTAATATGESTGDDTQRRDWRQRFASIRIPNPISSLRANRRSEQQSESANASTNPTVTPAQLEAGRV